MKNLTQTNMKNLTQKEIEFLKDFNFGNQNIWDNGSTAILLKDFQKKSNQSKSMISGLMSSLQAKEIISLDDCNGTPVIYIGYLFTQDEKGEKLFNLYKNEIHKNNN